MSFQSTGKLFVSKGEAGTVVSRRGKEYKGGVAIVFPAEIDHMHRNWFASQNPAGVPVLRVNDWYVTAARVKSELKFFLKDSDQIAQEIPWGHFHHAVLFRSWNHYNVELRAFSEEFAKYKDDLNTFVSFPRDSAKRALISNELNAEMNQIWQDWTKNFVEWVERQHPENIRLLWARERLEEAQKALKSTKNYYVSYERMLATFELRYCAMPEKFRQILVSANLTQRYNDMVTLGRLIKWLKLAITFPYKENSKPEVNILGGARTGMVSVSMVIRFELFETDAISQLEANGFQKGMEPILG